MRNPTLQNKIGSAIGHCVATLSPTLVPTLSPLTNAERAEKMECEAEIEYGLKGLDRLDAALLKMRDKKYYRDEFFTFEEYCTVKLKRTARWARHQIAAARVMQCLKLDLGAPAQLHLAVGPVPGGEPPPAYDLTGAKPFPLPDSERVARPLTRLPQEEVPAVWKRAVDTAPEGKVTARHIERVVAEHQTASGRNELRAGSARGKTGSTEGNEEELSPEETGFELARPKPGKVRPQAVEIAAARLEPKGDIREANCAHLFHKGPLTAVTIGNGNVFEHDGCNWVTLSQVFSRKPEDSWAECYCLVEADRYTGPEGEKDGKSYQGYRAILDRKLFRLGPMTIFKPARSPGGPIRAPESAREEQPQAAKAVIPPKKRDEPKPEVLAMAKRLYLLGSEAAGLSKTWGTASLETHMAFLGVAQFHLKEVAELKAKLGREIAELRTVFLVEKRTAEALEEKYERKPKPQHARKVVSTGAHRGNGGSRLSPAAARARWAEGQGSGDENERQMSARQKSVLDLLAEEKALAQRIDDGVKQCIPVGAEVFYRKGRMKEFEIGKVELVGYGRRFKILAVTGKSYWIELHHLFPEDLKKINA